MNTNHAQTDELLVESEAEYYVKKHWRSTPEDFCVFIVMLYATNNYSYLALNLSDPANQAHRNDVEKYAEVFMEMFKVDLSPYAGFSDALDKCSFRERLIQVCEYQVSLSDGIIETSIQPKPGEALVSDLLETIRWWRLRLEYLSDM
ncbi:hypothetical protein HNQ91_003277 [Filimonas zeae]|uniref:Uncharacterized protein n=1 Tax=Filimonas zeae TaxID=1737353 RepID=A0A917MYP8_9BACT|nr:hypothetical protein [Filimonas zeae]MDR6340212.1 hypothetical protein [Filimonas zeae]GGH71681.1 hypothetical protein GCM10011379_31280 [Filimonas zeae]